MACTCLIVDDHKILIEGIQMLLSYHPDISRVDGVRTSECLKFLENADHLPDVVMMDFSSPNYEGLYFFRELKDLYPGIKVIIFTGYRDLHLVKMALQEGAKGYVLKNVGKDELVYAINCVARHNRYIDMEIQENVIDSLLNSNLFNTVTINGMKKDPRELGITKREIEVLSLIVQGKTNNQIAQHLYLSINTVDTHRKNIMSKCNMRNVAELTSFALKNGIVSN